MYEVNQAHFVEAALETKSNQLSYPRPPVERVQEPEEEILIESLIEKPLLTQILPDPGYFAAGGLAGVISRTATGVHSPTLDPCPSPLTHKSFIDQELTSKLQRLSIASRST